MIDSKHYHDRVLEANLSEDTLDCVGGVRDAKVEGQDAVFRAARIREIEKGSANELGRWAPGEDVGDVFIRVGGLRREGRPNDGVAR